jgi:malate dehydrogenase (oxaloacetate-decarboxylating)
LQRPTQSPKVHPEEVRDHVGIIATGHYDRPNQTNNELTFPGVFKRALDVRAHTINEEMSSPPAHAIATAIRDDELLPK